MSRESWEVDLTELQEWNLDLQAIVEDQREEYAELKQLVEEKKAECEFYRDWIRRYREVFKQ